MNSPTQRSLALLREEGYLVAITEKWNQFAKVRQDLFGIGDLIAVGNGVTLLVQTTASAVANREQKVRANANAKIWLSVPSNKLEVHGWVKHKIKRGGTAIKFEVIRREIKMEDLYETE